MYKSPVFWFLFPWTIVYVLYSLQYSHVLYINQSLALFVFLLIFFVFLFFYFFFYYYLNKYFVRRKKYFYSEEFIWYRLKVFIFVYFCFEFFEVIISKGVPIYWLMIGSDLTYFDFGVKGFHGLTNALFGVIELFSFYLYYITRKKRYLAIFLLFLVWPIVLVTRNLFIVVLLQTLAILLLLGWRPSIIRVATVSIFVVFGFGYLGDFRTGADKFVMLAMPTDDYPIDFLPSGFLWTYIYVTTPFSNLLNTINNGSPSLGFGLNSITLLFPSFLREVIAPAETLSRGDLVSEAFNVSTAFIDVYKDFDLFGIFFYLILLAVISAYLNIRYSANGGAYLFYMSIWLQMLFLTIFFNHPMYLPILFQIVIVFLSLRVRYINES